MFKGDKIVYEIQFIGLKANFVHYKNPFDSNADKNSGLFLLYLTKSVG